MLSLYNYFKHTSWKGRATIRNEHQNKTKDSKHFQIPISKHVPKFK